MSISRNGDYSGLSNEVSVSCSMDAGSVAKTNSRPRESRISTIWKKAVTSPEPAAETVGSIIDKVGSRSQLMSRYKGLNQEMMRCLNGITNPQEKEEICDLFYKKITERFREMEHREDSYLQYGIFNDPLKNTRRSMQVEWVQKGDLLDALDALHEINPKACPLLEVTAAPFPQKEWNKETVPLVPYSKIKQATNDIGTTTLKTLSDVQKQLPYAQGELTGTAKFVRRFADPSSRLRVFSGFYRILTRALGNSQFGYYKKSNNIVKSISKFSLGMNIKSFEILCKKTADSEKDVFHYRGPKHLFGKSLYEYQSVNDWFKRDQTLDARSQYLTKVTHAKQQVEELYGAEASDNSYVICNADARVRSRVVESGHLGDPQELTGKILSDEAEEDARKKEDNAVYPSEKFMFSFKNLIGRKMDDGIGILKISKDAIRTLKSKARAAKKEGGAQKPGILQRRLLSRLDDVINEGLHELLGGFYRFFQKQGVVQVIQRLAPADVHNYVASLDGQPLSHKEAAEMLHEKLQKSSDRLKDNPEESGKIQEEIEHLKDLIAVFEAQEDILGHASQTTIDIIGTMTIGNQSVSTPAIRNQSRILAQNDRKIMFFKHTDGSFSMHVFIGATGVNKVDVDERNISKKQGDRQGDMQFGRDVYKADGQHKAVGEDRTHDGIKKLQMGKRQGAGLGGFPITGSTVISYFLPTDYTIIPEIDAYKAKAAYGEGAERAEIEILANMGDPIMVKTEIDMAQTLEKYFGKEFQKPEATAETILPRIGAMIRAEINTLSGREKEKLMQIRKIINSNEKELTDGELALKGKLKETIAGRLEVIRLPILEECFGHEFYKPAASVETIFTAISKISDTEISQLFTGNEKQQILQLREILNSQENGLTDSQKALKDKFQKTIASRLEIIAQDHNVLMDLFRGDEDVDMHTVKDMDVEKLDAIAAKSPFSHVKRVIGKLKAIKESLNTPEGGSGKLSKADETFKEELIVFLENRQGMQTSQKRMKEQGLFDEGSKAVDRELELTVEIQKMMAEMREVEAQIKKLESDDPTLQEVAPKS